MQTLRHGYTLQGGKYTIERELGQGSFGITYLALMQVAVGGSLGNINTKVCVAIKEFFMCELNTRKEGSAVVEGSNSELLRNYRRKFRTEAENLSRLQHPGIVKVLDVFDENSTTYYVMEYIEGQSLDEYIRHSNGLSADEALGIIRQVAKALGYMHSCKMLHLDLKPKNVMMDRMGKAYLIDFGLSKQYTDDGRPESSTALGLGTPGYAPMEQANYKQDGAFPATLDIYALGATLYKMLTGKTPPDSPTVFNDGLDRQPMVSHGVQNWLQDAVEKTMSPSKRHRPQTVKEFMAMIDVVQNKTVQSVTKQMFYDEVTVIDDKIRHYDSKKAQGNTLSRRMAEQKANEEFDESVGEIKNVSEEIKRNRKRKEDKIKEEKQDKILFSIFIFISIVGSIVGIYWGWREKDLFVGLWGIVIAVIAAIALEFILAICLIVWDEMKER